MQESSGCFVESNSFIEYVDRCPENSIWVQPHPEISESSAVDNWPVSRLDPSYTPGDVITFPGLTCADPIVAQALVIQDDNILRVEDNRIGEWECRQALNWINKVDSNSQSGDSVDSEQMDESVSSALTGQVWYWFAIFITMGVLAGSVFAIVRLVKK